jgi:hypothetical protein
MVSQIAMMKQVVLSVNEFYLIKRISFRCFISFFSSWKRYIGLIKVFFFNQIDFVLFCSILGVFCVKRLVFFFEVMIVFMRCF